MEPQSSLQPRSTAEILRAVAEETATQTGDDFFRALTEHLATALALRYCFIAECRGAPSHHAKTLAFWNGESFADNFEYELTGTPCQHVLHTGETCVFGHDVQRLFPQDQDLVDLSAESYVAVPMLSSDQRIIGHLAVLDTRPLNGREPDLAMLKIFAARAGAELERRRVLDELAASEQKYRTLFEDSNDGIFVAAFDGRLLELNRKGLTLFGYRRDEITSLRIEDLQPRREGQRASSLTVMLTTVDAITIEVPLRKKGDVSFPAEISARRLKIGDQNCILGLVRDLTERRRGEAEHLALEQQMLQAQKLESLGLLAGGIAHDFNNLLTGMLGNAGLALQKLPPDASARPLVEELERAAERAAELAQQMLAYSGRSTRDAEPLCLGELVRDMVSLLRTSVSKKAVLELELDSELPTVKGDATQLRQVVMNLLTNASDALRGDNGTIKVRVTEVQAEEADFRHAFLRPQLPSGAYVLFEVMDTGCGMEPAVREKIFDPFFTTKDSGRGLGMASVLGIVRGHGGAITVESAIGRGSIFRILLPACGEPLPATTDEPGNELWDEKGWFLVVDDEDLVRVVAQSSLENAGFEVLSADSGRRAVEVFQRHHGKIVGVLLDMMMPDMDGYETFCALRRVEPDVKVILSSGYGEEEVLQHFEAGDLAGFLQKPYSPAKLCNVVRGMLA